MQAPRHGKTQEPEELRDFALHRGRKAGNRDVHAVDRVRERFVTPTLGERAVEHRVGNRAQHHVGRTGRRAAAEREEQRPGGAGADQLAAGEEPWSMRLRYSVGDWPITSLNAREKVQQL